MGLFSRNSFSNMQTEEQRYAAQRAQTPQRASRRATISTPEPAARAGQPVDPAATVRKAGTLTRDRQGRYVMDGWEFNGGPDAAPGRTTIPNGTVVNGTRGNAVAGLSIRDLHALAQDHGPNCRCGIA